MEMTSERKPLLSDEGLQAIIRSKCDKEGACYDQSVIWEAVRDFYEAKITSGELRVVETATVIWQHGEDGRLASCHCSNCKHEYETGQVCSNWPSEGEHCLKCGAKIIK